MSPNEYLIANLLAQNIDTDKQVIVELSNDLVRLLSEQLYQSPMKAIEELVVNAYDADADNCRIYIPFFDTQDHEIIAVFDDGIGMDYSGLKNLWQVGRSNKRDETIERLRKRKQIGKFGIGKLATYTIANSLTHISCSNGEILGVSVDFHRFKDNHSLPAQNNKTQPAASENTTIKPIDLKVYQIENWKKFSEDSNITSILEGLGVKKLKPNKISWTLVILEDLKPKALKLNKSRLEWVLSTAMPLGSDFQVFLNTDEIVSSKEDYKKLVEFDITELPKKRITNLSKATNEEWSVEGNLLKSSSFPSGIKGDVFVTEKTLTGKKSDDLLRSHGFFIKVRDRLVDQIDPLFGMRPHVHGTLNRLHAEIFADDLDVFLVAARDSIEETETKDKFRKLLHEIFQEADSRYQEELNKLFSPSEKKEGEKDLIAPNLVEQPIADALISRIYNLKGSEANEDWFYISISEDVNIDELITQLYTRPRSKYKYKLTSDGTINRCVKFDPVDSTFWINTNHEFINEYIGDNNSRRILEDFVTAEMLLEVYLREISIHPVIIGEILKKRDDLLRSFSKDRSYSFPTIAKSLRDSARIADDLEINLVVAARALGFNATHISGSKKPDGLARFTRHPGGEATITLEAKSTSQDKKKTAEIDFTALKRHAKKYDGCLLLAPNYEGAEDETSAVSEGAEQTKVSCWTIDQLAKVLELTEERQIGAGDIYDIVTKNFSPKDVSEAINELLEKPAWSQRDIYTALLGSMRALEGSLNDTIRTIEVVGGRLPEPGGKFEGIEWKKIREAFLELAAASQGAIIITDRNRGEFNLNTDLDELERRVSFLTRGPTKDRRKSSFRSNEKN